jgi:hypothetical protein
MTDLNPETMRLKRRKEGSANPPDWRRLRLALASARRYTARAGQGKKTRRQHRSGSAEPFLTNRLAYFYSAIRPKSHPPRTERVVQTVLNCK